MRGIYKIINAVNNKFYVGSAVNFEKRKARHIWRLRRGDHINKRLQAAWNKYGEAAFVFAMVEEVPGDADILQAENVWLKQHVGQVYCYNIATDATAPTRGWFGQKNPMWGRTFKHTESAKAKIGAASKARTQSEEEKAKRRATMRGRELPATTRQKISASLTGAGNYWYGKKRPDHGAKVSHPVVAIDPVGAVTDYPSISALREALGVKPSTVNRALKSGKPIAQGRLRGWSIRYSIDTPKHT
jgi:group I intron endonuclease